MYRVFAARGVPRAGAYREDNEDRDSFRRALAYSVFEIRETTLKTRRKRESADARGSRALSGILTDFPSFACSTQNPIAIRAKK